MQMKPGKLCNLAATTLLRILTTLVFGYLAWYSFRYTYYFSTAYDEHLTERQDILWLHLLVLFLLFGVLLLVRRFRSRIPIWAVAILILGIAVYWVCSVHGLPKDDQKSILDALSHIRARDYQEFQPGGYFEAVHYQLGIATVFRGIFALLHTTDAWAIQLLNAVCVPLILLIGWHMMHQSEEQETLSIYTLLMFFCVPLLLYTSFVYGEILSLLLIMAHLDLLLLYFSSGKKWFLLPVAATSVLGVMTRGNFWIVLIASVLLLLFHAARDKSLFMVLFAAVILAAPICSNQILLHQYETETGASLKGGIPTVAWIAMGLGDGGELPDGWYNGYQYNIYAATGYDSKATENQAKAYIHDRLTMFRTGTDHLIPFMKEKTLTQWNEPTCEAFCATASFTTEPTGLIASCYTGRLHSFLEAFLNEYQLLLYVGMLFFALLRDDKERNWVWLVDLILLGGFAFSMLYEAKTRYTFPYYVLMIPCAAYGFSKAADLINRLFYERQRGRAKRT